MFSSIFKNMGWIEVRWERNPEKHREAEESETPRKMNGFAVSAL